MYMMMIAWEGHLVYRIDSMEYGTAAYLLAGEQVLQLTGTYLMNRDQELNSNHMKRNRKCIIFVLTVFIFQNFVTEVVSGRFRSRSPLPNILLILSDDHSYPHRHFTAAEYDTEYETIVHELKAKLHEWMIVNQDYVPLPVPPGRR